jgi:hypothetical protein
MRDLPTAPALLALGREMLLKELLALLPSERRLEALLLANAMAIAQREAEMEGWTQTVAGELVSLYAPNKAGADAAELLRRFSRDLRVGGFEASEGRDRRARAILWRLTLAKLRQANPKFLAANGFN